MSWHDLLPARLRAIFFKQDSYDDDLEIRERGYLTYVVISVLKFPFQVVLFPFRVPARLRANFLQRDIEDDPIEIRERGYLTHVAISVLKFPFQVALFPLQAFKVFQTSDFELDEELEDRGFLGRLSFRVKRFSSGTSRLIGSIASAPFRLMGNLWAASFSDAVFVIPVFVMFAFLAFVFSQVLFNSGAIKKRYLMGVQNSMSQGDFEGAKTYFRRLFQDGDLNPSELFQWAIVLAQTGEGTRADALIGQLAPEDRSGFSKAHRLRALSILSTISGTNDPNVLKRLHWHLSNSSDRSPEISRAWAAYYLALEMYDDAVKRLKETAELEPNNYLLIARIYKEQGQLQSMRFALKEAEAAFTEILQRDALDQKTRIKLASVYAQLEEYDNAEECLLRGMRIQPTPVTRAALSDFYVMRHDLAREADVENVENSLNFLIKAIDLDPNHVPIYERLMVMCHDPGITPEKLAAIRKSCQQVVGGDEPSPLAHFALSNILWAEGNRDQAKFHVEQAYQMDKQMVAVLNNLAWFIAHDEVPDLPRALELIEFAVAQDQSEMRLRSTYGTILMKLGRNQEAAREFELSLPGVTNRKEIHRKLAIVYANLGSSEMASIHRENSLGDDD